VSTGKAKLEEVSIREACKRLHLPTIAGQCVRLAEQAVKEKQSHLTYLDVLLEAEVEERERNVVKRRVKEAHFPKVKTFEEFDFEAATHISSLGGAHSQAGRRRVREPHGTSDFYR
jgi:DNA replication protein DnaC